MNNHWLYSIDADLSGEENMRRDEEMARACALDSVPRLRFYSWQPWTLSLGYNQDDSKIDRAALAERGVGLVTRPTGGRAVYHADEITYGVAMPSNGAGIHETYATISVAIKLGLERIGARDIEFSRSRPDFREHYQTNDSASCFSASALNELGWNGKKVVGSAQRRYGSVLLQHGSILLGNAHLDIVDFIGIPPERRPMMREALARKSATVRDACGTKLPAFPEIANALLQGFIETFRMSAESATDITAATLMQETGSIT